MSLGYAAIIVLIIIFISAVTMNKTDSVLKSKVSSMTSALNTQMKMNINSYLSRMEKTGTLVFATKEVYMYNAADENNDSYEALNTEDIISERLDSLCIMDNFVDFGIVYSNGHTVGKISNGTMDLFGDKLYRDLSAIINREKTNDGWSAGYKDNFKKIYYVKRIHEDALLVISVYATELESVFEHPGGIKDITVRLVDNNDMIIYSSNDDETGKATPDEITSRLDGRSSATLLDDEYLITASRCGDDWKVLCSVPTSIILAEKNEVQVYIAIIALVTAILAVIISIIVAMKISDPVDDMVNVLSTKAHHDMLTGLLNKKSFEELVESALSTADSSKRFVMILMDIDNFKGVNDTLGHATGDKVLEKVGKIMHMVFRSNDLLGRLGGDEFCAFLEIPETVKGDCVDFVSYKCQQLAQMFHSNYADKDEKYKVSASIGVALSPVHAKTFQELYKCADKALYDSKKKGKDTYTIYSDSEGQK